MPFSQKFVDAPGLNHEVCNDFPLAQWKQGDWKENKVRNALSCIEDREHKEELRRWTAFKKGEGNHPKRSCDGPMDKDHTDYKFKVEFDLSEADQAKLPYCLDQEDPSPGEFFMEKFAPPSGSNGFPYKPGENNQYRVGIELGNSVVHQCSVNVTRDSDNTYSGTYFDESFTPIGEGTKNLAQPGDKLILKPGAGQEGKPSMIVIRLGAFTDPIGFESAGQESGFSNPLRDFQYNSSTRGIDHRYITTGAYCHTPPVEESVQRDFQCFYPCIY